MGWGSPASALASCGHAAPCALTGNGPIGDIAALARASIGRRPSCTINTSIFELLNSIIDNNDLAISQSSERYLVLYEIRYSFHNRLGLRMI